MACPHTVFSNPPTCHAHTTTHTTATCRCCRAITAVAACPSTIPGMRHQQPAPLLPVLPPHPPLPPPLPHTTCAAAMHTAAAEPTAGARAATPERCCRYCLCCSLPPLLPLRCCRCSRICLLHLIITLHPTSLQKNKLLNLKASSRLFEWGIFNSLALLISVGLDCCQENFRRKSDRM